MLIAARPKPWQRALRALGCLATLALSLTLAHEVGQTVEGVTWGWLGTLCAIGAFLVSGPLFGGLLGLLSLAGRRRAWRELARRTGQEPLHRTVRRVRREISGIERGQRGWIVLVRGSLPGQGTMFQARVDLRVDEGVVGQWEMVRGPQIDPFGRTVDSLSAWDRTLGPTTPEAARALLAAVKELIESRGLTEGRGQRVQADVALIDAANPKRVWRRSVRAGSARDGGPGLHVVAAVLEVTDWNPW